MTDDKNSTAQSKTRARTTGLVTLAVISLLAGASVGASLEEFAAPEYAEDDWMAGVVDDATDDEDWDERKSEDSRMKKGAKDFIRTMMSDRMDDRMDDRVEHLEQRIAAGQELIIALRFCLEETACEADPEQLQEMIDNMEGKHVEMQVKIDAESQDDLAEEEVQLRTDSDPADDDETTQEDCEAAGATWSEERQECYREDDSDGAEREDDDVQETEDNHATQEDCEAAGGEWYEDRQVCVTESEERICLWEEDGVVHYDCPDEDEVRFDCRTKEVWSEEKEEWCHARMEHGDWHDWDDDRKMRYSEDKATMLEAASTAIAYCLENEACTADASAITSVYEEMTEKHHRHAKCAGGEKCHRGKDDRRGLMERLSDAVFGGPAEMEDREDFDTEIRIMADLEVPQEVCEERGGEWVSDGDASACVWPEYDRDCNKDKDRDDVEESEQEPVEDEAEGESEEPVSSDEESSEEESSEEDATRER